MKLEIYVRVERKNEMIKIDGYFSDSEQLLILELNNYFNALTNNDVHGKVINRDDFVRYEIMIRELTEKEQLILQFCVRENEDIEDGYCNFVHISNIFIPFVLRKNGIAKGIITIMSKVVNRSLGMPFYITKIVNDGWKENLLYCGGIEDESGDIEIDYDIWRRLNTKYGIAYLDKNGLGYTENEPYLYDCCCFEELKIVLKRVKNLGYKKLIPFYYNEMKDSYSWEDVERNKIEVGI